MLSLDNTYSVDELRDFDRRVRELSGRDQVPYVAELKLDGLSMALTYEDGVFTRGLTRGDGVTGEDVTQNVKTIRSVPLKMDSKKLAAIGHPGRFEVRGEVIMTHRAFRQANEQREKNGEQPFANPRKRGGRHHPSTRSQNRRTTEPGHFYLLPARERTPAAQRTLESAGCAQKPGL